LTLLYAGAKVPVPVAERVVSIARIVLLPVIAGVVVNQLAGKRMEPLQHLFPLLSVTAIVVIIAIIVALNRDSRAAHVACS
jgi:BASS family bile acid:Na+ symporter